VSESGNIVSITRTLEPYVTNAEGQLRVFAGWSRFELVINGLGMLSGHVIFSLIRYAEIKLCDIDGDGKVDLKDLVKVAKGYGKMPGLPFYSHDLDLNFDDRIDIGDLTTIAASIEG
jgi:hypothetical protein